MVALGAANSRMKDYYDLWAIPKTIAIGDGDLDAAIKATFERRRTEIPAARPPGLSPPYYEDDLKQRQWRTYANSIELQDISLETVIEAVWALVAPSCARLTSI
jgi:hypothetical protein